MISLDPVAVILGVGALLLLLAFARQPARSPGKLPVEGKPLMTAREREAIRHLERAVPQARVHAQVSMGALLRVRRGISRKEHMATRGRFSQKIVDFVLEDRASGKVLALVELDDRSHNADKDARRDEITGAGGYLTIRLPAGEALTEDRVRERVGARLGGARTEASPQ